MWNIKSKVTSSNIFCPQSKDIQFTITFDQEKQEMESWTWQKFGIFAWKFSITADYFSVDRLID